MRILSLMLVGHRGWVADEIRTAWWTWRESRKHNTELHRIRRGFTTEETFDVDLSAKT